MHPRHSTLILALAAAAPILSCGGGASLDGDTPSLRTPPATSGDASRNAPWALRYLADCGSDGPRSSCQGAYGFEVSSDGTYRLGPGPRGQRIEGSVAAEDLRGLRAQVGELGAATSPRGGCEAPGKGPSFELRTRDGARPFCDRPLLDALQALLARYAPQEFPDACADADSALRRVYDSTASCEQDSDCAFVSQDFLPLEGSEAAAGGIVLDDCSYATPLPAANAFRVVALQSELILKRQIVRSVCGNRRKPFCTSARSLDPSTSRPACIEGACRPLSTQFNFN